MTDCDLLSRPFPRVTRRATLGGLSAAVALGRSSVSFGAGPADARLVVLNIRGGLDGLATIIPYGDPSLAGLRGGLVPTGMQKVDSFFALHPSLVNFGAMMAARQGLAIHAVGPTVATRSHFDGQDFLQSGAGQVLSSGWLSRAIALSAAPAAGLSVAAEVPLLMRGPVFAAGYAPEPFAQMRSTLAQQMLALTASDPAIGPAVAAALTDRALFDQVLNTNANTQAGDLVTLATIAGSLLSAPTGPRVVSLETDSVDTHDSQNSRLAPLLTTIDAALGALKSSLGSAWANTVVLTMTEFGRTAYQNGTQGTDHGTGFAVLLAGGAVAGGRVVTVRWPGLTTAQLFGGRDLAPTVDFRAIAMGVLSGHMGLPLSSQASIFPGSAGIVPLTGLVTG